MERIGGPSPLTVPLPVTPPVGRVSERREEAERDREGSEAEERPHDEDTLPPEDSAARAEGDEEEGEAGQHIDARV